MIAPTPKPLPRKGSVMAILGAASLALLPMTARSDTPYTPDTIVEALIATADLGASRAVCIGTRADCTPEDVAGLDMRVGFDFDSERLTPAAQAALDVFAEALRDPRLEAADFLIEGHTDAHGPEPYNMDLSQRRAAAVRDFLGARGIDPVRMEAIGFGQSQPRLPNPLDGGNRRVELRAALR